MNYFFDLLKVGLLKMLFVYKKLTISSVNE